MKYKIEEHIGKKYNRVTITGVSKDEKGRRVFTFDCECGGKGQAVPYYIIARENVKSCGCLWKETAIAHSKKYCSSRGGATSHYLYGRYSKMIDRCYNPENPSYCNYGALGITVCQEWLDSFDAYVQHVESLGFEEGLEVDRIVVTENYTPENTRLVFDDVQNHNKRKKKGCTSAYIGVSRRKYKERITWVACIDRHGDREHLGTFKDEYLAAIAYDDASEHLYGDRPNKTVKE